MKTEWVPRGDSWSRRFGRVEAYVYWTISSTWRWMLLADDRSFMSEPAESPDAAKAAAEDAVRRFAAEIMETM